MKLLVFAHKPPPHHGQSYMVQLLLDALGGDVRQSRRTVGVGQADSPAAPHGPPIIECYHVDCRLSEGIEDIGRVRWGKPILILKYCLQAISCRLRFGVRTFYYVPAPALRAALYRDWLVMTLCRPFFPNRIFHWHAAGLAEWLAREAYPLERTLTRWLLGRPSLSIVLGEATRSDAETLRSARIAVVPIGIPDPCPDFDRDVPRVRRARAVVRARLLSGQPVSETDWAAAGAAPHLLRVLFLGLCAREKGLFDVLEAVVLANRRLAKDGSALRIQLNVVGKFWRAGEQREFEARLGEPELKAPLPVPTGLPRAASAVAECMGCYHGFVTEEVKRRLFVESDCLGFPTYYWAESFPAVLLEALAFGLPILATRWRNIPDLLPPAYPGMVEPRAPEQLTQALTAMLRQEYDPSLRRRFLEKFTLATHLERMKDAIRSVNEQP